jgi:intracellular sulfur oxidation DsrE/DsrF family protein
MSGLAALGGAFALAPRAAGAQSPSTSFQPTRHAQDEWMEKLGGKHRVIIDTVSPNGASEGLLFANNLFTANKSGYGLEDHELAIVICLRHQSAVFGFNNVVWGTHGKAFADSVKYTDPRSAEPPQANPYASASRDTIGTLAKRGVHFAVCDLSTRRLSRLIAGTGGDADASYKMLVANGVPNSHFVPAGVVAVTRAQEHGFSLLSAG